MNLEELKYPIGKFQFPKEINSEMIINFIHIIENFPIKISNEVNNLSDEQLDTQYRPEGWTIRQVVHHCADSHMNAFIRFKLALTEDTPIIKPYLENKWAELSDSKLIPIDSSLKIIEGLHHRWSILLNNLSNDDYKKEYLHPETNRKFKLNEALALYAWHCNHHLAHITNLKKLKGWF